MGDGIELKKVIEQLRSELGELAETAGGEKLKFSVESVEVELKVGVTTEGGFNGKAKFWVLELGGDAKHAAEQTQTIKLKLKVHGEGDPSREVLIRRGAPTLGGGSDADIRRAYGASSALRGRVADGGAKVANATSREVYVVFPRASSDVVVQAASVGTLGTSDTQGAEGTFDRIVDRLRARRRVSVTVGDAPRDGVLTASDDGAAPLDVTLLLRVGVMLVEGDETVESALQSDPEVGSVIASSSVLATVPDEIAKRTDGVSAWHLEFLNARAAHARGLRGKDRWIGIADTGLAATHPEFKGRQIEYRAFDRFGRPIDGAVMGDSNGHGTHVAGIAAGRNVGVAPEARLAIANVLPGGQGTLAQIFAGLDWLASVERGDGRRGVDVINLSMQIYTPRADGAQRAIRPEYEQPIKTLRDRGIEVVAAIGNSGPGMLASPGNLPAVIGVGAHDATGITWAMSCSGRVSDDASDKPDLLAPGVDICSAGLDGDYVLKTGTSMAAPAVSGLLVLMCEDMGASGDAARGRLFARLDGRRARF